MKNAFLAIALLVIGLAATSFVHSSDETSNRPAGVAKESWIPINKTLGFVLVPLGRLGVSPQLGMARSVSGYFMLRGASGWSRVVLVEPLRGPA
jgi:hypothetical protein